MTQYSSNYWRNMVLNSIINGVKFEAPLLPEWEENETMYLGDIELYKMWPHTKDAMKGDVYDEDQSKLDWHEAYEKDQVKYYIVDHQNPGVMAKVDPEKDGFFIVYQDLYSNDFDLGEVNDEELGLVRKWIRHNTNVILEREFKDFK